MDKVAVVILNYLNYKDTFECIESIKTQSYDDMEIIVVDNGSSNESWPELEKKYSYKKNIHLIKSKENLGFAKGNNLGIKYARQKLKSDFILLVNNDTIFKDSNLISGLMNSYENNVGIIGPRIISVDSQEQNPVGFGVTLEKIEEDYKFITSYKYTVRSTKLFKALKSIDFLVKIKKKLFSKDENSAITAVEGKQSQDMIMHGACMLLTRDYFKYYPCLFSETFLYYEENIITLLTKKVGLEKKFIPDAWIYHKEDQSSKMSFNNLNSVKIKYQLESMEKCKILLNENYDKIYKKYFKKEL